MSRKLSISVRKFHHCNDRAFCFHIMMGYVMILLRELNAKRIHLSLMVRPKTIQPRNHDLVYQVSRNDVLVTPLNFLDLFTIFKICKRIINSRITILLLILSHFSDEAPTENLNQANQSIAHHSFLFSYPSSIPTLSIGDRFL